MDVNTIFQRLKYRASKSGYVGAISSNDFNLIFPSAELKYYLKEFGNQNDYRYGDPVPRISYPTTLKVSTSLAKFSSPPTPVTIDSNGQFVKPNDLFFIDSLSHVVTGGTVPTPITRVEKQNLADNLYSYFQPPTEIFPIYVEYATYIQFYPLNLATGSLIYLKAPTQTKWAYTLNGTIGTTNTLVPGSGYTDGIYPNVNFTGGVGNGASGTVTVVGGIATNVQVTSGGFTYKVGDTLTGTFGGGTGFSFNVAAIVNAREVYDPVNSVDPLWSDFDVDEIIYLALTDIGAFLRDTETEQFANSNSAKGGIPG